MASPARFAEFELNPSRFELRRAGTLLRLERIPMDVLILLVESNGQIVTREQIIQRVWGKDVFLDTEHGINTAIRKIRQTLGDNPEQPRFLQTVTGRGYRFIANVTPIVEGPGNGKDVLEPAPTTQPTRHQGSEGIENKTAEKIQPLAHPATRIRRSFPIAACSVAVLALGAAWLLRTPLPAPKIVRTVQLTSDGLGKGRIVTDGRLIYFSERVGDHWGLAAVPVSGGEVIPIYSPLKDPQIFSISPNKSQLLVGEGHELYREKPLWLVPLLGGSPRRFANVLARGGSWSPDGQKFAFVNGNDVYLAKPDGTEPNKLPLANSDSSVWPWLPTWSPDGKRLRFDRYTMSQHTCSLWQFTIETGRILEVFPQSESVQQRCMGVWTADQKYYLFSSWKDLQMVPGGGPVPDIWAIREKSSVYHKINPDPVQLTVGPIHFSGLIPSPDGTAIFATGDSPPRGELILYDAKTQSFRPFLSGSSRAGVSFSRDGAWIAYIKFPQGELWRSKADGSDPLQLTFPPLIAYGPSWSPDGKHIAFGAQKRGTTWQPYVVSADGSTPQLQPEAEIGNDPTWSPDGKSLLLGPKFWSKNPNLQMLDLMTHDLSVLPGSEGMVSPRWSPDGQHISALSGDQSKLMLFDVKTQKWSLHSQANANWQQWSHDGKHIYFASLGPDPGIFRVGIADHRPKRIASLKGFRPAGFGWFTLDPEDQPLLLRDVTVGSEIYALQWEAP